MDNSMMRFKNRDAESGSPRGTTAELTDDDDDSKNLIPAELHATRPLDRMRAGRIACIALSVIGALALLARGLMMEVRPARAHLLDGRRLGSPLKPEHQTLLASLDLKSLCTLSWQWADMGAMHVVTWNIAAINNNPFE